MSAYIKSASGNFLLEGSEYYQEFSFNHYISDNNIVSKKKSKYFIVSQKGNPPRLPLSGIHGTNTLKVYPLLIRLRGIYFIYLLWVIAKF